MQAPSLVPRRTIRMWLAGICLLAAACTSTLQSADRYVVLESQKFT